VSGSWSATDSPGASYDNESDNWFRTKSPIDLGGHYGCNVRYAVKHQLDFGYDYLNVARLDGACGADLMDQRSSAHRRDSGLPDRLVVV
jgi:hypothetical protein